MKAIRFFLILGVSAIKSRTEAFPSRLEGVRIYNNQHVVGKSPPKTNKQEKEEKVDEDEDEYEDEDEEPNDPTSQLAKSLKENKWFGFIENKEQY